MAWGEHPPRQVLRRSAGPEIASSATAQFIRRGEFPVLRSTGVSFDFVLEEWGSDTARDPSPISSSSGFFIAGNKICVRETWTSSGAGLARIKLAVNVDTTSIRRGENDNEVAAAQIGPEIIQRTSLLQHQFLAGWMTLSDPSVTELPLGGDGPNDAGNPLGSGVLNTFWADSLYPDRVTRASCRRRSPARCRSRASSRARSASASSSCLTRGRSWPQRFATDENPDNENPSNRWDIHDESALGSFATEGHPFAPAARVRSPTTRPVNVTAGRSDPRRGRQLRRRLRVLACLRC